VGFSFRARPRRLILGLLAAGLIGSLVAVAAARNVRISHAPCTAPLRAGDVLGDVLPDRHSEPDAFADPDSNGNTHSNANGDTHAQEQPSSGRQYAFHQVTIENGYSGVIIEDTEIDGQNTQESVSPDDGYGLCCSGFTALRLNVHGNVVGITTGGTTLAPVVIQDSWIHDLHQTSASHNEDFLTNGDTVGLTIRHNRLDIGINEVAAIFLQGYFSPVQNVLIDNNLLNGGGFTMYGGCDGRNTYGSQCQNISFTNNRFMRTPEAPLTT
jgi:hypothetical protein